MEKQNIDECVNHRVIYAHSNRYYRTGVSNPLMGTQFFCIGTLVRQEENDRPSLLVRWDNGKKNHYEWEDLEFCGINRNDDEEE